MNVAFGTLIMFCFSSSHFIDPTCDVLLSLYTSDLCPFMCVCNGSLSLNKT